MDPNRFDHLTKSLASGLSRRRVLGGVLGAVGGALGLRGAASAAFCHGLGGTCATKANCCGSAVCVSGTCQPPFSGGGAGCLPGFTSCGGQCKLLLNDTQNCGACGNVCPADQPVCGGRCLCTDTSCPAGQACCSDGNGACVDLTANVNNCGGCGTVCSGGDDCNAPVCTNETCGTAPTNEGGPCNNKTGTCLNGTCVPKP